MAISVDPRRAEMREATYALLVNSIVWIMRLLIGILINSLSLIAEAWHSFSDNITSMIVYIGGRLGSKPPDEEHPYGHGKIADLATVFMSSSLIGIGVLILYESLERFLTGYFIVYDFLGYGLFIVVATGLLKEILARYALKLYRLSGSTLCYADAWHHRVDASMSIVVLLSFIGFIVFNTNILDLAGTFLISGLLIREGVKIFLESSKTVIDTTPVEMKTRIREAALEVPGVIYVHDIRVRNYGGKLYVDMKIHVDPTISLSDAHNIAHSVEKKVKSAINSVEEVLVHCEPGSKHD